ncbi:MAG: hypothetical protein LBV74_10630 [Tannerella sp.]|jgi:hypothetical protein|nr:hypothetical protein [Tannerella sp.]
MNGVNKKKNKINYANRFTAILFVALMVNLAFYWLPDSIFGMQIKKVDLLSDIRIPSEDDSSGLLALFPEEDFDEDEPPTDFPQKNETGPEINISDSVLNPPVPPNIQAAVNNGNTSQEPSSTTGTENSNSQSANPNETSSQTFDDDKHNTNYLFNTNIEDFTSGHTGLRRFFAALNNINSLGRPVRIAFVGDSFIEGDIVVADFRAKMQERFGGRGVGFIPISSNVSQYRPTIKQSADGWKTYSIIKNKNRKYVISGLQFEPASNSASVQFQTVDMYPRLEEVSSLKFIYSGNTEADMVLKSDMDTSFYELPPTESITQYEIKGHFSKGVLQFKNAQGLKAIGIALEDNYGVIVDNFSLRGNSGIIMSELDSESCRNLQQIRPYDLIVLQYGLNVASDSVREYGWYRNKMVSVIEHMQHCFPGADILMLGVSDRSHKRGSSYSTMPAVVSLLRAQRQTAKRTEVAFWSIFAAMGGENSMVKYVNSNWASKDYTHLSFRGGREIANALYDAIITEKGLYDGDEKLVER